MSIRLEYPTLRLLREQADVDVIGEIAEVARKTYCNLYSNNPGWIFVKDNLTIPIVKRASDRICDDYPPPPPSPDAPFSGGQCEGSLYLVTVTFDRYFNGEYVQELVFEFDGVPGAIQGAADERNPNDSRLGDIVIKTTNPPQNPAVIRRPYGGAGVSVIITNVSVEPKEGQLDDCGDPPAPPFPELPPPSDEDSNTTVTVTNNNGDSFEYDVQIQRGGDGYFYFPTQFNISGTSVTLDLGGVTINNRRGGGGGSEVLPPPKILEEEEEEEKEVEELPEPEERTFDAGTKTGGHIRSTPNLVGVIIRVVDRPSNEDITYGEGSPDVRYWGWFEWQKGDAYYERQFLHFANNYFRAPDEVTGYAAFYKKGYSGNVTETTIVEPLEGE